MLTPSRRLRPLMGYDRELIRALGCTEKEYREFMLECERYTRQVAASSDTKAFIDGGAFLTLFLINLAIGLAFTGLALLLAPKPRSPKSPVTLTSQKEGQDIVTGDRFSAKSGFDSLQNVVEIGSIVPMVYARRERIGGIDYGGVRVNTNLLWSQLLSLGGSQMFRGVFLIGQGGIGAIDPLQFAIGDNLLSGYGLDNEGLTSAKVTFYARLNGGRLRSGDYISGRQSSDDEGNFDRRGASDIYQVPNESNAYRPDACSAVRPATQTQFGLYAPIGSCLTYRVNPTYRPLYQPQIISRNAGENYVIVCIRDPQVRTDRQRDRAAFHPRITFPGRGNGEFTVDKGDEVEILLGTGTDADHVFRYYVDAKGTEQGSSNATTTRADDRGAEGETSCLSAGSAVAGRQKSADDSLVVGERYLLGTAIGICIRRSNRKFQSRADFPDFDGDQQSVSATFRIISRGRLENREVWSQNDEFSPVLGPRLTGTGNLQVFKIAIASITLGRKCRVIEVGIRSTVGIQVNGLCNFRDTWSYDKIDSKNCLDYEYDPNGQRPSGVPDPGGPSGWPVYKALSGQDASVLPSEEDRFFRNVSFQNGVLQLNEERYSFWRIKYRRAGANNGWTILDNLYGVRSETLQPVYNYIRMAFPSFDDWEFEFNPVSGWEVRREAESGPDRLFVIDFRNSLIDVNDAGLRLWFNGERVRQNRAQFSIKHFEKPEPNDGYNWATGVPPALVDTDRRGRTVRNYVDGWDRLAEVFMYDEITTSVQSGPEHEIAYVNIIEPNRTTPQYDNLAIVGMNLRAGPELTQLSQLSAYVTRGLKNTHLFPEVLYDMLTNPVYEANGILSPEQINKASFDQVATFTAQRRYFCDIALSEPINRREWGAETASNFLLDLVSRNGRLFLQQAFLFDRPEPITTIFTKANIIEDSFSLAKVDLSERLPIQVSVRWRQERQGTSNGDRGIFPLIREVTVREVGTPANAPLVRLDMTDYCTSQQHAIDAAKYRCRQVRLQTEVVSFRTFPQYAAIEPGRAFKVAVEDVVYSAQRNGIIDPNGVVLANEPLPDGTHHVLRWASGMEQAREEDLEIRNGRAVNVTSSLFTVRSTAIKAMTAKVSKVALNEDSEVEVEGILFPVDDRGFSLFADGFDDRSRWIIEGEI